MNKWMKIEWTDKWSYILSMKLAADYYRQDFPRVWSALFQAMDRQLVVLFLTILMSIKWHSQAPRRWRTDFYCFTFTFTLISYTYVSSVSLLQDTQRNVRQQDSKGHLLRRAVVGHKAQLSPTVAFQRQFQSQPAVNGHRSQNLGRPSFRQIEMAKSLLNWRATLRGRPYRQGRRKAQPTERL